MNYRANRIPICITNGKIVKKSDGTNRFCKDYRKLNRITRFDAVPIGNPDKIFARLSKAKYFSKLDLSKGYWQIPVKKI